MAKDCRDCKSYKDCGGKEFYTYSEIRFCPYQIIFVVENAEILETGGWPPNPNESGYTETGKRKGFADEAYYTKPVGILAEVEYRRERTGIDGKLLKAEILAELDLSEESKTALLYIKGWRRKSLPYQRWKAQRRYRKKLDKPTINVVR